MRIREHFSNKYLFLGCVCCMIIVFGNFFDSNQIIDHTKISKSKLKIYAANDDQCSLKKCFDIKKCKEFKIYIYKYPVIYKSSVYINILSILKKSRYYTPNPNKACLFISAIDTLAQDPLNKNFVRDAASLIPKLKYWNHGKNHIIFNMYSGTYPNYREKIPFDTDNAIRIKTSVSAKYYRKNFDISFPLFYDNIAFNNSKVKHLNKSSLIYGSKKYFLTFKGKRYLQGTGSNVRNKLYHLNNQRDVILLTTCKHGLDWTRFKDRRCDADNLNYDKYDYNELLNSSTFCLIPRGRRLDTYRFLESLKVGCVVVLLSDGWILPFSEIINWNRAIVRVKENQLMQVNSILREIPYEKIIEMRKLSLFLYEKYFSSLELIIDTTVEILRKRIERFKILNDMP
ncbi:exostosin-1 [Brachionus plicatilis]|uniref:Exostosin-1 n=1 Tax=Brachionus plicatilis TaxID=10195 RepID=A0A3M7S596_BRAPC|nr:exostosin-1 [Brachionus plicatilis]